MGTRTATARLILHIVHAATAQAECAPRRVAVAALQAAAARAGLPCAMPSANFQVWGLPGGACALAAPRARLRHWLTPQASRRTLPPLSPCRMLLSGLCSERCRLHETQWLYVRMLLRLHVKLVTMLCTAHAVHQHNQCILQMSVAAAKQYQAIARHSVDRSRQ